MKPNKYNPNMNSGQFRHKITIQEFVEGTDEEGFPIDEWQEKHHLWAMIRTDSNSKYREYYEAASEHSEKIIRFITRYTSGINSKMRITYRERVFDIIAPINDDELNKTLTIIAKEVV